MNALYAFANIEINVSPNGSDTEGDGTKAKPFATLTRAIEKVGTKNARFLIKEGVYELKESINLNLAENVEILGIGNVEIIGAKRVSACELQKVIDKQTLSKLRDHSKINLYKLELKKFGIIDCGEMRQRGFGAPDHPMFMEVFHNASRELQLARYPNKGILTIGKIIDTGYIPHPKHKHKNVNQQVRGGKFIASHDIFKRWIGKKDLWLGGILSVGWADDHQLIKSINPDTKEIELSFPHQFGLMSSEPKYTTNKQDVSARGYYIYNALEEIDSPFEYYIDHKNLVFHIGLPRDPKSNEYFDFTILDKPLLKIQNSKNVKIKNIKFSSSRGTGLYVLDSTNLLVSNCVFKNFGKNGAYADASAKLKNPATNYKFTHCHFIDNGMGGLQLGGGDRKLLISSENLVSDCLFERNDRIKKNYSGGLTIRGVGCKVTNCEFHNASHLLLLFSGNDHTIENSIFSNACYGTSDMGAVYTGRNPSNKGIKIRNNFFVDIQANSKDSKVSAIYIDDGSGGMDISKNIFCRCSTAGASGRFAAIFLHGGHDNIIDKNVFIECEASVAHSPWNDKRWKETFHKEYLHRLKKEVDIESEPYKKYKCLDGFFTENKPRYNSIQNSLFYETPAPCIGNFRLRNIHPKLVPSGNVNVKNWNIMKVKKYFGENKLVADILKREIGMRK